MRQDLNPQRWTTKTIDFSSALTTTHLQPLLPSSSSLMQEPRTKKWTHPTAPAAPAVSTQGPQKAIDYLDGAEKHLNTPDDQQDREEGEVPGHNICGFHTQLP